MSSPRAACLKTLLAEYGAANFWLERNLIVSAAIIANNLIPGRSIFALRSFFGAALSTSLRRHHVPLIKCFLIFFAKDKYLAALNTRDFNVRHSVTSFSGGFTD
jgi:hypothetical protein